MKYDNIFKFLNYFSIGFIILVAIELILIILFSSIIKINLGPYTLNIITLLFTSGFTSSELILEWLILIIAISGFLIFGIILLIVSFKKKIDFNLLAKFLLMTGMFFLISGLIKMYSINLLANSTIQYNGEPIVFQTALYTESITEFIGAAMWIFFSAVTIAILMAGLVIGAIGLKTILNLKEKGIEN